MVKTLICQYVVFESENIKTLDDWLKLLHVYCLVENLTRKYNGSLRKLQNRRTNFGFCYIRIFIQSEINLTSAVQMTTTIILLHIH